MERAQHRRAGDVVERTHSVDGDQRLARVQLGEDPDDARYAVGAGLGGERILEGHARFLKVLRVLLGQRACDASAESVASHDPSDAAFALGERCQAPQP